MCAVWSVTCSSWLAKVLLAVQAGQERHQNEQLRGSEAVQDSGAGRRRSGQVRPDPAVCPAQLHRLPRPHHRRCLPAAHRHRLGALPAGHSGHRRAGGVHRHAGAVHAVWRGLYRMLLHHGQALLPGVPGVPEPHPEGEGPRPVIGRPFVYFYHQLSATFRDFWGCRSERRRMSRWSWWPTRSTWNTAASAGSPRTRVSPWPTSSAAPTSKRRRRTAATSTKCSTPLSER